MRRCSEMCCETDDLGSQMGRSSYSLAVIEHQTDAAEVHRRDMVVAEMKRLGCKDWRDLPAVNTLSWNSDICVQTIRTR